MSDAISNIELGVHSQSAFQNVKALREEFAKLKTEMGGLDALQNAAGLTGLQKGLDGILSEVKRLNVQFDDLGQNVTKNLGRGREATEGLTSELKKAAQEFLRNERSAEAFLKVTHDLEKSVIGTGRAIEKMNRDGEASAREFTKQMIATVNMSDQVALAADKLRLKTIEQQAATEALKQSELGRFAAEEAARVKAREEEAQLIMMRLEGSAAEMEAKRRAASEENNIRYARTQAEAQFLDRVRNLEMKAAADRVIEERETEARIQMIRIESLAKDAEVARMRAEAHNNALMERLQSEATFLDRVRNIEMKEAADSVIAQKEAAARIQQIHIESLIKDKQSLQERADAHNNTLYAMLQAEAQFENRKRDLQIKSAEDAAIADIRYSEMSLRQKVAHLQQLQKFQADERIRPDTVNARFSGAAQGDLGNLRRLQMELAAEESISKAKRVTNGEVSQNAIETERARRVTQAHAASLRDAHSAARGLAGGFQMMWLTWGNIVPLMAGFAFATAIKESIAGFIDVEYQMTFVKELTEDTTHSVGQLGERMHTTAKELGIRASEASSGMRTLAQAGLDTEQAYAALPSVFKLAVVGETTMANAAVSATGIMHAFGKEIGQIAGITDVLTKSGSLSSTSVDQMTESMKVAAPTAHQYKVSLEETAAILTALAKSNITGSAAGTATKNMIKELASPSTDAVRELHKMLKFSAYDSSGQNLKPIIQQINELREAIKGYNRESQSNMLVKMFGERGDKAFFSVANMGTDELQKMLDQINNSAGFTADVFFKLQRTIRGQWQLLVSDIDNSLSQIGETGQRPILDMMRDIRAAFADPRVKDAIIGLTQSVVNIGKAAILYGPPLLAFFAIWKTSTFIATGILGLSAAIGTIATTVRYVATGVAAVGAASAAASTGVTALGGALTMVVPPWLRLIGLITAAAAAYLLLKRNKESALGTTVKELSDLDGVASEMKKENDRVAKELELREQRKDPRQAQALAAADDAKKKVDFLREQAHDLMTQMQQVEGGTHPALKGDNIYTDKSNDAYAKMTLMHELREDYTKATKAATEAEKQLGLIAAENARGQANSAKQKALDERDTKEQTEKFNKENPAGNLVWTPPDRNAGQRASAVASNDGAAIMEAYRVRERMAKDVYKNDLKLANDYYQDQLIDTVTYLERVGRIQQTYRDEQTSAEKAAREAIDKVKIPEPDKRDLRGKFENAVTKVADDAKIQANQDRLNESLRLETEVRKSLADARKYEKETLPEMATKNSRAIQLQEEHYYLSLLPEAERAVIEARRAAETQYDSDAETLQREITQLKERIALSEKLISLGPQAVGRDRYEDAWTANIADNKQLGAKEGSLSANKGAASTAGKLAADAAKAQQAQLKWNQALTSAVSIADRLAGSFGKSGAALGKMTVAIVNQGKEQVEIENRLKARKKDAGTDPIKLAEAEQEARRESAESQIRNYGDIMGAAKGFFGEHTAAYKGLEAAEKAFRAFELAMAVENMVKKLGFMQTDLATFLFGQTMKETSEIASVGVVEATEGAKQVMKGTTALANQASEGDPYSAWARMAAMAATLAAIGVMIGGGGGGGQKSAADIRKERQTKQGTGTVLGMEDKQSESIGNSIDLLASNSKIGLTYTNAMLMALNNIRDGIGGLAKFVVSAGGMRGTPGDLAGGGFGDWKSSFWGFNSGSKELIDSGIASWQGWQNFSDLKNGGAYGASRYQDIRETNSSWWGFDEDVDNYRQYSDLSHEFRREISRVIVDMGDAVSQAGQALGYSATDMEQRLNSLQLTLGDMSFAGMNVEEIQKALEAQFSSLGDVMAKSILPGFESFQKGGEGYLQTVMRVSSATEAARWELEKLGVDMIWLGDLSKKNGDIQKELIRESIMKEETRQSGWREVTADGRYSQRWEPGQNRNPNMTLQAEYQLTGLGKIMKNLSGSASDLAATYKELLDIQEAINDTNGKGIWLNEQTIRGAGGLSELKEGINNFRDEFYTEEERRAMALVNLQKDFADKGLLQRMPKTREEYRKMVEEWGQAGEQYQWWYGWLVSKSDEFAQAMEDIDAKTKKAETYDKYTEYVDALTGSVTTLFNVMENGAEMVREIDRALDRTVNRDQDIAGLWYKLSTGNVGLEQQLELAGQLKDLVLEKYTLEKENAQKLIDASKELKEYADSLKMGDMSPLTQQQKLAAAQQEFQQLVTKARGGDQESLGKVSGSADQYLKLARDMFASSPEYTRLYDTVLQAINGLQVDTERDGTAQLNRAVQEQASQLERLREFIVSNGNKAESLYTQQLNALQTALLFQDQMAKELGKMSTLPQQIASLPASLAVELARVMPRQPDAPPLPPPPTGTPGGAEPPPSGGVGGMTYLPSQMTMMSNSPQIPGESWLNRYSRVSGFITEFYAKYPNGVPFGSQDWSLPTYYNDGRKKPSSSTGGTTVVINGSHAEGLDYVPFDGYVAKLHKGERVLTAAATAAQDTANAALVAELRAMREELAQLRAEQTAQTGALLNAHYDAQDRAADKVVQGNKENLRDAAFQERSKPTLA